MKPVCLDDLADLFKTNLENFLTMALNQVQAIGTIFRAYRSQIAAKDVEIEALKAALATTSEQLTDLQAAFDADEIADNAALATLNQQITDINTQLLTAQEAAATEAARANQFEAQLLAESTEDTDVEALLGAEATALGIKLEDSTAPSTQIS